MGSPILGPYVRDPETPASKAPEIRSEHLEVQGSFTGPTDHINIRKGDTRNHIL